MILKLDLQFFAGEKTEKATPKKRQETRKKGQTAKSQDVNSAIIFLFVFLSLFLLGPYLLDGLLSILRESFQTFLLMEVSEKSLLIIIKRLFQEIMFIIGPVMIIALVAAIFSNYIQIGFLFSTEPLKMKLEKIDPIKGFKRIFSIRALVELFKSLLKIVFVGTVTFLFLWFHLDDILMLINKKVEVSFFTISKLTIQMGLYATVALLFLSILDYMYQKYDFEKNIRMSKQDIKDEYKNTEGDPLIRSRIKQRQREMAMRRMMQEVPNADVIITNPTHYAVALKYDENKMDAPYVVAKGVDFVAQKIKLIGKENDIVMVENRPLARALHDQVEIGEAIPDEFFKAVAEILAYVYRIKQKI
jgi:flagellar biosynthesis protein FlhB